MRPAKIQIRLRISAVRSGFSPLGAVWIAKDADVLHAGNENSDQTARTHMLILVCLTHISEGTFPHIAVHLAVIYRNSGQVLFSVQSNIYVKPNNVRKQRVDK